MLKNTTRSSRRPEPRIANAGKVIIEEARPCSKSILWGPARQRNQVWCIAWRGSPGGCSDSVIEEMTSDVNYYAIVSQPQYAAREATKWDSLSTDSYWRWPDEDSLRLWDVHGGEHTLDPKKVIRYTFLLKLYSWEPVWHLCVVNVRTALSEYQSFKRSSTAQ
jgi:hypothetical protein